MFLSSPRGYRCLTTNNHSTIALSVALVTQNVDSVEKAGVLAVLILSHLPTDAIPHGHYYSFERLRQTWPGAVIELGIGLVGLPLLVWYLTSASILWLFGCVLAASLFDFGVATGSKIIDRLNTFIHWWDKNHNYPNKARWQWEILQTIILLAILYFVTLIFRYH